jgi:quercetin dioxygenase-like cupin family protein
MRRRWISRLLIAATAGLLPAGCGDQPTPTAPAVDHSVHPVANLVAAQAVEPFTVRGSLDPFRILDNPEFMMHSRATSDIVMQRLVFAPGVGGWHTHPGPSFVFVVSGQIRLDRVDPRAGCTETPVFGPGEAYFEVANEVHRSVVVSSEDAVLQVTRFNIPVGAPISTPAADPGC